MSGVVREEVIEKVLDTLDVMVECIERVGVVVMRIERKLDEIRKVVADEEEEERA